MAPKCKAASLLSATGSETIIFSAPAIRAPCTIDIPMPPRPVTSTVDPTSTFALLNTEPTPVWTAHPMTQAISRGVSWSSLTTADSGTIVFSEKPATPKPR